MVAETRRQTGIFYSLSELREQKLNYVFHILQIYIFRRFRTIKILCIYVPLIISLNNKRLINFMIHLQTTIKLLNWCCQTKDEHVFSCLSCIHWLAWHCNIGAQSEPPECLWQGYRCDNYNTWHSVDHFRLTSCLCCIWQ